LSIAEASPANAWLQTLITAITAAGVSYSPEENVGCSPTLSPPEDDSVFLQMSPAAPAPPPYKVITAVETAQEAALN